MEIKKTKLIFVVLGLLMLPLWCRAQSQEKIYMHKGNKEFFQKQYVPAETYYRKALTLNAQNSRTLYNLGNSLFFQQKPKDAMKEYESAAALEKNPKCKASIYHNMGVILQSQKQFGPAIECYKEALRQNPSDHETRYNLALCQYQLKNQPQDQNKQNQQNQEEKDDKQQQQKKEQKQDEQQPPQEQEKQKNQMSKDNADQLLKAAQMKENRTQEKVRQAKQAPRRQMENNW